MAMPHVLSGLIAKRAEPAGEIEAAEARLRELRAALEPISNELMIDIALGRPGTLGEEGTR